MPSKTWSDVELAIVLLVMFPLLFAWIIGLSTVGGYLGRYVRADSRPSAGETGTLDRS